MPPSTLDADLLALRTSLSSLRDLLTSFQTALQSPTLNEASHRPPSQPADNNPPPNPLALLSDASQLLKAQTTKLSLLILNRPFSAREATHLLSTLSANVLPALMSGWELLQPQQYTSAVREHVTVTLGILWREVRRLLDCVPATDGGGEGKGGDGALASTGVLWEQCDELVSLGESGVRGLVDGRMKGYAELVDDAIAEIDGWDPEGDTDDEEEEEEDDGNSTTRGGEKAVTMATPTTSDEEEEEEEAIGEGMRGLRLSPPVVLKGKVLKFLRLLRLFYPAMRKRRVATCPNVTGASARDEMSSSAQQVERLDRLVGFAQHFSEETDELAGALYADESGEAVGKLDALGVEAKKCALLMETDWNGQEDEFCTWLRKWSDLVRETTI